MKVLFIPWNDREPVEVRELDHTAPGYFDSLKELVFGDAEVESKLIEIYSVPQYMLAFAFDEEGMYNQADEVNSRAQKLMAHAVGARPDQLVDLHGNYVAYGYTFNEDAEVEYIDVPGIALNYFAEEGIGSAD